MHIVKKLKKWLFPTMHVFIWPTTSIIPISQIFLQQCCDIYRGFVYGEGGLGPNFTTYIKYLETCKNECAS